MTIPLAGCSGEAAGRATPTPTGPTFSNPIKSTGADPWAIKWQDRYLLAESRDGGIWLTVSPAADLTGIDSGTQHRIWAAPVDGPQSQAVWAPELHHVGGHWYVYFAATTADRNNANHRMFVLESASDDPLSTYTDRGPVSGAASRWAIDGTRFNWAGKDYFVWSGWPGAKDGQQNLYIARMTTPTALAGTGVLLSSPTLPWERTGMPIEEGPEALQHDGKLVVVFSASGSWTDGYCLGMLRFTGGDPLDPASWQKSPKPVFAGNTDVVSPGHGSFTTSPDGRQDWIVYHSARYAGAGWDRVIDAQRFTWRSDGTPDFGSPIGTGVPQSLPSGQAAG
ncbi:MAG TPA: glycoside hydrolase family 43 protein [Amnibacterium sp.]|nr:glycoside hydrolase family 43 protein [Amnibacterium sp.]